MNTQEAIKQLRDALKIANCPDSMTDERLVTDGNGNITAASMPYRFGYMETCIRYALSALDAVDHDPVYCIEADGNAVYYAAATENKAYERFQRTFDVPRHLLKITKMAMDDVPSDAHVR